MEDLAEQVEQVVRRHPRWARIGGWALGLVAVGAAATISWEMHELVTIARHQSCVADAQATASFSQSQGAFTHAVARCFADPQPILGTTQVIVPGVVSVRLGEAMNDLTQVGLKGRLIQGPAGAGAYIIDQAPRVGESVPAGTVVEITTRSP